jgi:integrase
MVFIDFTRATAYKTRYKMLIKLGALTVQAKYLFRKSSGLFCFRRGVPESLRPILKKREILKSLGTHDPTLALKRLAAVAAETEATFKALSGATTYDKAVSLLASYNMKPIPIEAQPDSYLHKDAYGRDTTDYSELVDYLSDLDQPLPHEELAFDILKSKDPILLSATLDHALTKTNETKRINEYRRAFDYAQKLCKADDVKVIDHYDLQDKIDRAITPKHQTIRRYLNLVKTALDSYVRLKRRKDFVNPFDKLEYTIKRTKPDRTLTPEALSAIRQRASSYDRPSTFLTALLIDTGARIAELAGLRLSDVVLDSSVPHLIIAPNSARSLKNANSERLVPLFGQSLQAATLATELAKSNGHEYLFQNWIEGGKLKEAVPALAVAYLLKPFNASSHWLRHTMNTRSIEAGVTEEIRNHWFGWGKSNMASYYGKPQALQRLSQAASTILEEESKPASRWYQITTDI